ncbi:MAG: hypothetical protein AAB459_02075 [Patescibacteria group bacterium]
MSAEIYSFETRRSLGIDPVGWLGKLVSRAERTKILFQEARTLMAINSKVYSPNVFVDKGDRLLTEAAKDGLTDLEIEQAYFQACQDLANLGLSETLQPLQNDFDFSF